jgi:hypothetical protein
MIIPLVLTVVSLAVLLAPPAMQAPDAPLAVPAALLAVAAAWSFVVGVRKKRRALLLLGGFQVVLGVGLAFWLFGLSAYEAPDGAPRAGVTAPDIEAVRVPDGAEFRLSAERGRPVVFVFFRGAW